MISSSALSRTDRAALQSAALLWCFGYLLVVAMLRFTRAPGGWLQALAELPVFGLALILSLALYLILRASQHRPFAVRLLLAGVATVATSVLLAAINITLLDWLSATLLPDWRGWAEADRGRLVSRALAYFFAFSLNCSIFWGHLATAQARSGAEALARSEHAAQQAELAALRLQLNPHFLFNTLNSISSLVVMKRNEEAEIMLDRLSDFLRASLENSESEVQLDDELARAQAYLDIEAVRFGERLSVDFSAPVELLRARVPSFLLQPLLENAMKYAVAPSKRPVHVAVRVEREGAALIVTVEDDGEPAFGGATSGTGLGLANIRQRLQALYGDQSGLEAFANSRGFRVTVRLPLRLAAALEATA